MTHILLRELVAVAVGPGDVLARSLPLIGHDPQAIGIGQGIEYREGFALKWLPLNHHRALRGVIEVRNGGRARTPDGFGAAPPIEVTDTHGHALTHIRLGQCVGAVDRSCDLHARPEPLIGEVSQTIGIGQGRKRHQGLALLQAPFHHDAACRGIVQIGHPIGGGAGAAFERSTAIPIAGLDRNHLTDIGLCQDILA